MTIQQEPRERQRYYRLAMTEIFRVFFHEGRTKKERSKSDETLIGNHRNRDVPAACRHLCQCWKRKRPGKCRNQLMRRNFVDNNHDGNCDNRGTGQGRQMRQGPGFSQPNGARSGARDRSGPINRSGGSRPSYTDANHDGICDNATTK